MSDEIEIRESHAEDVDDTLKQLWIESIREGSLTILPTEANAATWARFTQDGLNKGRNFLLVAKTGNRTIGYALANVSKESPFELSEPICFLNDVYVAPEFRGKGIGKRLTTECLSRMKTKGFETVRLNVLPENKIAIRLYEKLGFKTFMYGMNKALEG
jgi:ribosomal protein S18 acetylase RimI-like enzyme